MIQRLSHTCLYVLDQNRAKRFYTEKLGFEVRTDVTMGDFRWLTVSPSGDPDEIVLMAIGSGPEKDEAADAAIRTLVSKGKLSGGVFETANCRQTYEQLSAKGVEFMGPPQERPYGLEAMFKDDSGNWFSLVQRPK
jgi:catechol 2,3-dioxygenase-like lactoylglutathione lyase family enzyme